MTTVFNQDIRAIRLLYYDYSRLAMWLAHCGCKCPSVNALGDNTTSYYPFPCFVDKGSLMAHRLTAH